MQKRVRERRKIDHRNLFSSACSTQLVIVDRFLEKFTLNADEIRILSSSTEPVSNEFFEALNHLQQIHSDCQLLLTTKNQTAG